MRHARRALLAVLLVPFVASCAAETDHDASPTTTAAEKAASVGDLDDDPVPDGVTDIDPEWDGEGCPHELDDEGCEPPESEEGSYDDEGDVEASEGLSSEARLGNVDLSALGNDDTEPWIDAREAKLPSGGRAFLLRADEGDSLAVVHAEPGATPRVDILPDPGGVGSIEPVDIVARGRELWAFGTTFTTRSDDRVAGGYVAHYDGTTWTKIPFDGARINAAELTKDGAVQFGSGNDDDWEWTVVAPAPARRR